MSENPSVLLFTRLIAEKHERLKNTSSKLLHLLVGEDPNAKQNCAKSLYDITGELLSIIAEADRPSWLSELHSVLNAYVNDKRLPNSSLLDELIRLRTQVNNHEWSFSTASQRGFDFDALFEQYREQSRLPELFEKIVQILEEIKSSGEVDSITMLNALSKIIATIKRSRKGSYFSTFSTWQFIVDFLRNYMWAELASLPIIGNAMKALEKTIKDTDLELRKLDEQVRSEMKSAVEKEFRGMTGKVSFPSLTYSDTGLILQSSDNVSRLSLKA